MKRPLLPGGKLLCSAVVLMLLCGAMPTLAQQVPVPVPPRSRDAAASVNIQRSQTVYLHVDGNVVGRVSLLAPTGVARQTRAVVSLVQNGRVIVSSRSDERGNFQIGGGLPGVYSLIAVGQDGAAIFGVQVLPYDENATESLRLDIALVPSQDALLMASMLASEVPLPPPAPPIPGAGVSGGGGGGAGLWPLLGLGGLGGLAGLAGKGAPASPHTP
jgi:hypothetical protein